ncbi:MAG: M3 family metallopeptidase, partial [Pseudomonadota bacterium]
MKKTLLSCAALICFAAAPVAIAQPELGPMWDDDATAAAEAEREPVEWDLTRLFPDVDAWDAARLEILERIEPVKAAGEDFSPSAAAFADLFDQTSDIARDALRVSTYAFLDSDTNLRDGEKLARRGQAQAMFAAYGEAVAWINPMVQSVGETQIEAWIASDPRLEKHAFGLRETLRATPHTLSAEGEALMAAASVALGGAQRIYTQLKNSDIPWPTVTLSTGEELRLDAAGYVKGRAAENREDRLKVFNAYFETYQQFESSLGEALGSHVQRQVFNASQRKYDSDIPWPTVTLSTGEELRLDAAGYVKGRAAENREDRLKVFNAYFETYQQFESSLGEALGSHVQRQVFNASQRKYDSALEAALADDNIPREVYDTLLSEVNAALPTLHRYFKLRARIMGVEDFAFHDIYPNLVETD